MSNSPLLTFSCSAPQTGLHTSPASCVSFSCDISTVLGGIWGVTCQVHKRLWGCPPEHIVLPFVFLLTRKVDHNQVSRIRFGMSKLLMLIQVSSPHPTKYFFCLVHTWITNRHVLNPHFTHPSTCAHFSFSCRNQARGHGHLRAVVSWLTSGIHRHAHMSPACLPTRFFWLSDVPAAVMEFKNLWRTAHIVPYTC